MFCTCKYAFLTSIHCSRLAPKRSVTYQPKVPLYDKRNHDQKHTTSLYQNLQFHVTNSNRKFVVGIQFYMTTRSLTQSFECSSRPHSLAELQEINAVRQRALPRPHPLPSVPWHLQVLPRHKELTTDCICVILKTWSVFVVQKI